MNYQELGFSDASKLLQQQYGSRDAYERIAKFNVTDGLSPNETRFIEQQDHFFMASIGTNGYPYIQHRGGPRGFVKMLDHKSLAFVDFSGNKQFISVGNISTNSNVSLIFVSYTQQARLKIYAIAKTVELSDDPSLFDLVDPKYYKHKPERMIILSVNAFDWNCPQHITPRYTAEEVSAAFDSQKVQFSALQEENKLLRAELERYRKTEQL